MTEACKLVGDRLLQGASRSQQVCTGNHVLAMVHAFRPDTDPECVTKCARDFAWQQPSKLARTHAVTCSDFRSLYSSVAIHVSDHASVIVDADKRLSFSKSANSAKCARLYLATVNQVRARTTLIGLAVALNPGLSSHCTRNCQCVRLPKKRPHVQLVSHTGRPVTHVTLMISTPGEVASSTNLPSVNVDNEAVRTVANMSARTSLRMP